MVHLGPLAGLIGQLVLLGWLGSTVGLGPLGWLAGLLYGAILSALLVRGLDRANATGGVPRSRNLFTVRDTRARTSRRSPRSTYDPVSLPRRPGDARTRAPRTAKDFSFGGLGPANAVTLTRATLVGGVTGLVVDGFVRPVPVVVLVTLAAIALLLDGVDGQVARRTGTVSALGGRFDMEIDAFLILVLSVQVAQSAGWWVLAIGAARYAHLVGGWVLPWLRATVPPRYWRKPVAAIQGIVLTVAVASFLPTPITVVLLVLALILLAESFGRDDLWLWRMKGRRDRLARRGKAATIEPQLVRVAVRE